MPVISPIIGFIYCVIMFLLCLFTVLGSKYLLSFFIKPKKKVTCRRVKPRAVKPPQKNVRTIQIDPDEIDKIYVGKMR